MLVARAESLTASDVDWAAAHGIGVWRPGADFVEVDGGLARWMRAAALDFVLARPDRVVFGAGASDELPRVRAAFDRWLDGRSGRARHTTNGVVTPCDATSVSC